MTGAAADKNLQVMEPVSCGQVFERADYLYQVKWDGVRMLAFIEGGRVTLINKRHHERTQQYPELQKLPGRIQGCNAVLDGEIVALKNGKPSFPAVMSRDNLRDAVRIHQAQSFLPIDYMVFDILHLDGDDLTGRPLEERQHMLRGRIDPEGWLHLVEDFPEGSALFESVCRLDMEGIVAKQRQGRYIGGKQHHDWFKIKYRRKETCRVGGYTLRGAVVNALLLGWEQGEQLLFVGRAGSGLTGQQQETLSRFLPAQETASSPFANITRRPAGYHFVEPALKIEVEFAEWTEDMHLRAPVIKGFID
ncbi:MAG: non-homologous end-joining DNA ligase [Deltaproteobacteria bacterium]